jgi:hypothetical protein
VQASFDETFIKSCSTTKGVNEMSKSIVTAMLSQNSQYVDGMGRIIPEDAQGNPNKIAELIGATYHVEKRPVFFKQADGKFIKAIGRDVLVRPDGVFSALQTELADHNLKIAYGTAIKGGSLITVCAELPSEFDITVAKGDILKSFLIVSADYNSKHKSKATKGLIRTVSGATLSSSLEESTIADLMKVMKTLIRDESHTFKLLFDTEMSNKDITKYFSACLDVDPADLGRVSKGNKVVSTKTENILKGITQSYVNAPGAEIGKGTVWGALQAVCYYATHLKTVRDTSGSGVETARAASNLTGDANRLKVTALDLALSYATRPSKAKQREAA